MNKVTILGTNSALPTSGRFSSAQVLQMFERYFLIDCAEGTQMRLRQANISFARIKAIFISHLHSDHFLGIFGMLSTFSMLGRKHALSLYAPKGLSEILNSPQARYLVGELQFELHIHTLPDEDYTEIYSDKKLTVHSIRLHHRIDTWGFYFKEKPSINVKKEAISQYNLSLDEIIAVKNGHDIHRPQGEIISNAELRVTDKPLLSYAYISDTAFFPQIAQYIQGVRLLYHEATFLHSMLPRAIETFHTTARQAGEFAKLAQAERLLIGHFSARYKSVEELEKEAKEVFANTVAAKDLESYPL
ncbi:MAG: ribonuclease Z [Bacteroidales bacterium]|jgi:ribonuclease Z|nr:ribonuclease Z [Bacteroidales bacterium]